VEEYLGKSIKEVMTRFPAVEQVLDDFGIGCGPCSVGDCLLKDIVAIHHLSPQDEWLLMARIAGIIFPDQEIEIPEAPVRLKPDKKELRYSPPVRKLVEEHKLIKRCLALIPQILENADLETEPGRELVRLCVDFIRNYADRYHHAKEEDILFKYFPPGLDILQVMHKEHDSGRAHVRAVLEGVEKGDRSAVVENLLAYRDLLTEHIKKEDEILYPWMDRSFTTSQVGELFSRFGEVDGSFGDTGEKYREFIESLEEKFCRGRVSRLS